MHTAVKIAPAYKNPVIHVLDASRSVTVVNRLVSDTLKEDFVSEIAQEYEKLRVEYSQRNKRKTYLSLEKARENRTVIDWKKAPITPPAKPGIKIGRASSRGRV